MKKAMVTVGLFCMSVLVFAQTSRYTNTKYGFSILLPEGWTISEPGIEQTSGVINNYAVRAASQSAIINVIVADWYEDKATADQKKSMTRGDLDVAWNDEQFIKEMIGATATTLRSTLEDFQLYEQEIVPFDETKALRIRYSALLPSGDGGKVQFMVDTYMLVKNGVQYCIGYGCLEDSFQAQRELFSQSIQSFHAPFNLDSTQKAGALTAKLKTITWQKFIKEVSKKAFPKIIIGMVVAGISILAATIGVKRAARKNKQKQGELDPTKAKDSVQEEPMEG